jgi:hypothetical protein
MTRYRHSFSIYHKDSLTTVPKMRFFSTFFLLSSSLLPLASAVSQTGPAAAVASPDGLIVPFSTKLPACASLCGKLFDVQGACTPPNIAAVSQSCFCTDGRLTPFLQPGTAGVSSVCGPESCQDATSLGEIQSWYEGYCNEKSPNPTTTTSSTTSGAPTATGTGSDSQGTHVAHSGGGYTWYVLPHCLDIQVSEKQELTCHETGWAHITDGS